MAQTEGNGAFDDFPGFRRDDESDPENRISVCRVSPGASAHVPERGVGHGKKMLERMELPDSDRVMRSYPFQLSGGMRQRVGIAMAMTFQPKLLLADEPTSALDVTTQAQIVRQMLDLRGTYRTGILLVTHNLGVAAYMADKILVMKEGCIVEAGSREQVLYRPSHAYTRALIDSVPSMGGVRFV